MSSLHVLISMLNDNKVFFKWHYRRHPFNTCFRVFREYSMVLGHQEIQAMSVSLRTWWRTIIMMTDVIIIETSLQEIGLVVSAEICSSIWSSEDCGKDLLRFYRICRKRPEGGHLYVTYVRVMPWHNFRIEVLQYGYEVPTEHRPFILFHNVSSLVVTIDTYRSYDKLFEHFGLSPEFDQSALQCCANLDFKFPWRLETPPTSTEAHDDVIKWKHFLITGPCAGNSPVTGEFPTQRPVTRSFDVSFDLCPNKRLSKQLWGGWFETPSHLWRHCEISNFHDGWKRHPRPLQRKCLHSDGIFITGCIGNYKNDNFQCSKC